MKDSPIKKALVKFNNGKEGQSFIKYLENKGFLNIHHINFDKLRVKVIVVTENEFFSTNITCLAVLANYGIKPISVDEFINRYEPQTDITNTI